MYLDAIPEEVWPTPEAPPKMAVLCIRSALYNTDRGDTAGSHIYIDALRRRFGMQFGCLVVNSPLATAGEVADRVFGDHPENRDIMVVVEATDERKSKDCLSVLDLTHQALTESRLSHARVTPVIVMDPKRSHADNGRNPINGPRELLLQAALRNIHTVQTDIPGTEGAFTKFLNGLWRTDDMGITAPTGQVRLALRCE